jgi:hypothetical protein
MKKKDEEKPGAALGARPIEPVDTPCLTTSNASREGIHGRGSGHCSPSVLIFAPESS